MIPAKIEPISIAPIREKAMESIIDWFDQHKQSFYILGWVYLRSQQQMEELFYRSIIKVHKEFPRYNRETSFETRVTSIFVQTCQELSKDGSLQAPDEPRQDLFKAIDRLNEEEKGAMALTYIKGIPREEAAHLVNVSEEKLKEHLFSGIQSLKKGLGYGQSLNGCKEYHKDYMDYLERNLDRPEKVDFEIHIYHCQNCQEDLGAFQEVLLTMVNFTERIGDIYLPSDFMQKIKARLAEREKHRQLKNKKQIRIGIAFASIFALLISIEVLTGYFTNFYYSYTEEDQQLRGFLRQGMGEVLNLEAESDGVKITIKSAIADDVQTLVFYEIEDTAEDSQYMIDVNDGVSVENRLEFLSNDSYQRNYPPDLESDANNQKKNIYRGKISLLPLRENKGTIKLKISKLQKLMRDSSLLNTINPSMNMEKAGEWKFNFPVTKQPSAEYALDKEIKVEGIPVRFDKLTIAPTATILQFNITNDQPKKRIEALNIDHLEVNNKKVKADTYGSIFSSGNMDSTTFQAQYDPLFGKKPKEVIVQLESAILTVEDRKTIELDASHKYPQTFEYAGSTISIDKYETGQPTRIVISNHEIKNRAYESLQFDIMGEDTMEIVNDGVLVDKNGKEYNPNEIIGYEQKDHPRYFDTVQKIELNSNSAEENVTPKMLEIHGYNTTKYLDDIVKISLE
ncbi:DUF4179 domain-containing protein [Neobacillus terrae]|uniref:DUF4179 domain-containing protein n=1 Tax=Neobacillus terrae TaxID=3034837 RepID=UPI00140B44CC|nr:DUF4179 domain-containing protein [Neobacillus terrae]NHM31690.1 DUF4179 domain-containing protein [Neobacillus terrae]